MKKKVIGIFAVLAIVALSAYNVNFNKEKEQLSALALANIQALANNENGTNVGYCYLEQAFSDNRGWKSFCSSRTNSATIYPCPSGESYGGYSDSARDRCTR